MLSEILAIAISVEYLEKGKVVQNYRLYNYRCLLFLFLSPALFRIYDA